MGHDPYCSADQSADGFQNLQQNGNNNLAIINSVLTHPPKEVELRTIANSGVYLSFIGIVISFVFYIIVIMATTWAIRTHLLPYIPTIVLFAVAFIVVAIFSVSMILWADKLSFMIKTAHVIYKDQSITYDGRSRKFYDEIWDIKLGNRYGDKVIYCYGININAKRKPYRLRLVFINEAEAKYLHDVFHAGKYMKREVIADI